MHGQNHIKLLEYVL